jgi:oxepin-CoA hydrolase/3-oxo-5,6-dehydrosuberyl-CoA semialdehyde dehydrogenase
MMRGGLSFLSRGAPRTATIVRHPMETRMITLKSWLQDAWHEGTGEWKTLVNPATEEPVARAGGVGADLPAALDYGRRVGGPHLRAMTFAERGELLGRMSKVLFEVRDALIDTSIASGGTTRGDAKFDIDGATGTLAYYAGIGKKLGAARVLVEGAGEQLTRSPRFFGYHIKTPRRGIAVHVNAFNFPAWGMAEKAAVAILAGMPVLTKPATATALLAFRVMERLVEAADLPRGVLQFAVGDVGDLLQHLQPQDVLAFTGGSQTSATMRRLDPVVHRSVRINIEADSLNAAVLGPDAEPGSDAYRMFVRDVTREMTQKAGQKCTAVRRILVPAARIDDVQADLAAELAGIKVGDPALEEVRMGPLATAVQARDVRAGIAQLQKSGARIVFGDPAVVAPVGVPAGKGFFVPPVLLRADQPHAARAVHEHEVFGPVATLLPYTDAADAAAIVALGQGSLVASVYTDDRGVLDTLVHELAPYSGRVFCGSGKIADQATPPGAVLPACVHGGPGRAGDGEELGGERGLDFYLQRTAVQGDRALLDRIVGGGPGEIA